MAADFTEDSSAASRAPSTEDVRAIGEIIRDTRNLSAEQVGKILEYQRDTGARFGEAAIALNYATAEDVLQALAQQFNYAFGSADRQKSSPELVVLNQPFSRHAEAIRAIRAQVMLRHNPEGDLAPASRRAIAVVSPDTGDGKTFFAANLAIAFSQLGQRTLVIDADLRGPRLHEVFDIDGKTGLSGLLAGRRGDKTVRSVPGVPNLYLLPCGATPPNPLELVQSPAFGVLLHELLSKFDHVIVDTPAGIFGADAPVIAMRCGLSVVIARKNSVRVDALQDMVSSLSAGSSKILGVVMNDR